MKKLLLLALVTAIAPCASAQSSQDETKKLQEELALVKARTDLFLATYPKIEGGKSGDIENSDKLLSMVSLLLPSAVEKIGKKLGGDLQEECPQGTTIMSGAGISDKILSSESYSSEFSRLKLDVKEAKGGIKANAVPLVGMSSIISYVGLFKSDYSVASTAVEIDKNWLIASMMEGGKNASERFPDRTTVSDYVSDFDQTGRDIDALLERNDKQKKLKVALKDRFAALRVKFFKPDSDGMLPIVTTALLSKIGPTSGQCLAFVSSAIAAPMLLTKENIFGKGGHVFLYLPVEVSAILLNAAGRPMKRFCYSISASAPIKLSALTRFKGASIPWSNIIVDSPQSCLAPEQ